MMLRNWVFPARAVHKSTASVSPCWLARATKQPSLRVEAQQRSLATWNKEEGKSYVEGPRYVSDIRSPSIKGTSLSDQVCSCSDYVSHISYLIMRTTSETVKYAKAPVQHADDLIAATSQTYDPGALCPHRISTWEPTGRDGEGSNGDGCYSASNNGTSRAALDNYPNLCQGGLFV